MKSYKDLIVWQKAYNLSLLIYKVTSNYPKEEVFGLVSQMRRASVSIISNIAEGNARGTKEYIQFLKIAFGSGAELEVQIELSKDLNLLKKEEYITITTLHTEVMKMLNVIIKKLSA
jgi:four helix bundle protein